MKAIQVQQYGEPDVLQLVDLPDLTSSAGAVVVRSRAISINFTDIWSRMGSGHGVPPFVPGMEVAGVIEAVGPGVDTRLRPGQRVLALTPATLGGYAEQVLAPANLIFPLPDAAPFEDGACFGLNYFTAYSALHHFAQVRQGERVLIHSGAGGVGLAAVQLARQMDAEIFATASANKHDFLREQGVRHPIDYHAIDFEKEVRRLTEGAGVDVALDSLGAESFQKSFRLLRFGGRLVCYGASALISGKGRLTADVLETDHGTISFGDLMNNGRAVMGAGIDEGNDALVHGWMARLLDLYLAGKIKPHVDRVFPLQDAAQAHHYVQDRLNRGKVLLGVEGA
jgi:NADPH:quinone reductase-like Zn-dependent oxidoreductase